MERLGAHPEVGAYGEVLLADREGWPDWPRGASDRPFFETYLRSRGLSQSSVRSHRHLFRFLDYLFEPRRGFRAIGFKLMYNEAWPYPEILGYLKQRQVRVLHLIRENLLDIALSQIGTAARTKVHAWSAEENEHLRIVVDTEYLRWWLRWHERERRIARLLLRAMRLDSYELSYESLVADDRVLDGALRHLGITGISGAALTSRMVKLAPMSHREGIANYADVERCVAGSRFERFLRP